MQVRCGADIDLIIHSGSKSRENKPLGHIKTVRTIVYTSGNIAILAGVVNFLPHPNPPRCLGEGVRNSQMI